MSSPALESFLARLYTDERVLKAFMTDPQRAMAGAGLSPGEERSIAALDRASLLLSAQSFEHKRMRRGWHRGSALRRAAADLAARLYLGVWRWLDGGPRPRWHRPHRATRP